MGAPGLGTGSRNESDFGASSPHLHLLGRRREEYVHSPRRPISSSRAGMALVGHPAPGETRENPSGPNPPPGEKPAVTGPSGVTVGWSSLTAPLLMLKGRRAPGSLDPAGSGRVDAPG